MKEIVIISAVRTPVGKFQGALKSMTATQLGAHVVKNAVERAGLSPQPHHGTHWRRSARVLSVRRGALRSNGRRRHGQDRQTLGGRYGVGHPSAVALTTFHSLPWSVVSMPPAAPPNAAQ